jgi:oligoribonuclease
MLRIGAAQHSIAADELLVTAGGARQYLAAGGKLHASAGAVRDQDQSWLACRGGPATCGRWFAHPDMMPELTGARRLTSKDHLIWIDLEMTGLRPEQDSIIEIATVVTDRDLNVVADGPELAISQSEAVLATMDEWNQRQHGGSGLLARVRASQVTVAAAERQTLDFLAVHVPAGVSPMCGNSICQDRRFLARCMPALEKFFHYRNLDVSTLKELAARWYPQVSAALTKQSAHLARADIYESIAELRHYRERLFVRPA